MHRSDVVWVGETWKYKIITSETTLTSPTVACCIWMRDNMQTHSDTGIVPLYLHAVTKQHPAFGSGSSCHLSQSLHWIAAQATCPSTFITFMVFLWRLSAFPLTTDTRALCIPTESCLMKTRSSPCRLPPTQFLTLFFIHCGCVRFFFFFSFQMMHVDCILKD